MAWDIEIKYKIYRRLADELFFRIYKGVYPIGKKLPAYLTLAKEAESSPETVRKAIWELYEHKILEKTPQGYFVTSNQEKLNNLYYDVKEQRRCSTWRKTKNPTLRNSSSRLLICTMPEEPRIHN